MEVTLPARPRQWLARAVDELGLYHLWSSSGNVKLICLQRVIRLFAYGGTTVILVAYLKALGISDSQTGLFMTLTSAGDVLISLCLTLVADKLGRRKILAIGALLMATSGVIFATAESYWILLAAAVIGVINPSGNEIGPFRAIEESTLAHLTAVEERTAIFTWYILLSTAGVALGLMTSGWLTTALVKNSWQPLETYRVVFVAYAVMGGIKLVLSLLLGKECEIEHQPAQPASSETQPLLSEDAPKQEVKRTSFAMLPKFSRESKVILFQLCLLFAVDNFASGLATLTWTANYFQRRFILSSGAVGSLFFTTSIISAVSMLFAAPLARRIGNIRTMVFTHLPASILMALIGIPSQPHLAISLVVLRACTQSMDTAPRMAFIAANVLPEERTVTMGVVNVVKTLFQSLGPLVTGVLAGRELFWVAFLAAGSLKVVYDLGMLMLFAGYKTREASANEQQDDS